MKSKPDPDCVSTLAHTEIGCWSIIVFIGKVARGFSNWKMQPQDSKTKQRVRVIVKQLKFLSLFLPLPGTLENIFLMSMLSRKSTINKRSFKYCRLAVRFLSRQGLASRGDGDESDGNLQQLLCLQSEKDPSLARWLKRKENVYTSLQIQNEMYKTLRLQVLQNIATDIRSSPFVTVVADETNDASNREQFTVIIRRVSEDLQVDEEFSGLQQTSTTDAEPLQLWSRASS